MIARRKKSSTCLRLDPSNKTDETGTLQKNVFVSGSIDFQSLTADTAGQDAS